MRSMVMLTHGEGEVMGLVTFTPPRCNSLNGFLGWGVPAKSAMPTYKELFYRFHFFFLLIFFITYRQHILFQSAIETCYCVEKNNLPFKLIYRQICREIRGSECSYLTYFYFTK